MTPPRYRYRTLVAAGSLVLGPLLMSVGDLVHPEEREDAAEQVAILIEHASRWYAAHLLLFIGALVFIPGILAISRLTAEQKPAAGHAGRILLLMGGSAFSSVFVFEMLIGRYVSDGGDLSEATALIETFQSVWVLGVVMPAVMVFFVGIAIIAVALLMTGGQFRLPALGLGLGAFLILAEIITSQVLLSQIGNIVLLASSAAFAWEILRSEKSS